MSREMGVGTFGKVFKCDDRKHRDSVAIKAVRSIKKYIESAEIEVDVLKDIYTQQKRMGRNCCVKLFSNFRLDGHFFMVFEPLGSSLYDLIKKNDHVGFPLYLVRKIAK